MAKSELEKLIKERDKLVATRDTLKYEKSKANRDIKIAELNERITRLSPKVVENLPNSESVSATAVSTFEFRYKDFLDTKVVIFNSDIYKYITNFFNANKQVVEFISETDSKHSCYCCVDYKSYPSQKDIYSTQVVYDYLYNFGIIDYTITLMDIEKLLLSMSDFNSSNSLLMCLPMVNIRVPKRVKFKDHIRFFKMWCLRSTYTNLGLSNKEYVNDYYYSTSLILKSELKRLSIDTEPNQCDRLRILRNVPYVKFDLKQRHKEKIDKEQSDNE